MPQHANGTMVTELYIYFPNCFCPYLTHSPHSDRFMYNILYLQTLTIVFSDMDGLLKMLKDDFCQGANQTINTESVMGIGCKEAFSFFGKKLLTIEKH